MTVPKHPDNEYAGLSFTWLLPLFMTACAGFTAVDANAQEYFARGQIEVTTKVSPSAAGRTEMLGFYAEVLGHAYKVRIVESGRKDHYYEYAFADGDMHILHHVAGKARVGETNAPSMFPARIEKRDYPPNDGTRAQFVWFALASHRSFENLTNDHMYPIWSPEDPRTRRQPFQIMIFPELLPELPGLPAHVSFINDGVYRSYNPVTKELDVRPLVSPYDMGYTNAIYQILALTNTAVHTLPAEFVFTVYSSPVGSGEVPFERVLIHGVVTEVGDVAPERATIADFKGIASVADYRIHGTSILSGQLVEYKYAAYPVTNATWLDSNQLVNVRKRHEKNVGSPFTGIIRPTRRLLVVGSMALLSVSLAWILWRGIRRGT